MTNKEDIIEISKRTKFKPYQEERRYLQCIILHAISNIIVDNAVFKGGTNLMFFFSINRFSEDLDFTLKNTIDVDKIKQEIIDEMKKYGIECTVKEKKSIGKLLLVSAKGPLFTTRASMAHVKLDFSERRDLILPSLIRDYVPPYNDVNPLILPVMDPIEVAAEKVRAIQKRNYARDVYDLYFLLKKGFIPPLEMINKKLNYYKEEFSINKFEEALDKKKKIWSGELKSLMTGIVLPFNSCKETIMGVFRNLDDH